jgi:hypothetical protein
VFRPAERATYSVCCPRTCTRCGRTSCRPSGTPAGYEHRSSSPRARTWSPYVCSQAVWSPWCRAPGTVGTGTSCEQTATVRQQLAQPTAQSAVQSTACSPQPTAQSAVQSTACSPQPTVQSAVQSTACSTQPTVQSAVQSTACSTQPSQQSTAYSLQSTAHSPVYSLQSTAHSPVYSLQSTAHSPVSSPQPTACSPQPTAQSTACSPQPSPQSSLQPAVHSTPPLCRSQDVLKPITSPQDLTP